MRQILFRLRLDDWFRVEPVAATHNAAGGLEAAATHAIGVGWLLLPWLVYFAGWLFVNRRRLGRAAHPSRTIAAQFVFPIIVLLLPFAARAAGFDSDGIRLHGYGLMVCLGFLAGCWTAARRAHLVGMKPEDMWDAGLWMFGFGLLGARLFYILQKPQQVFFTDSGQWKSGADLLLAPVALWDGGLVVLGCVPLGLIGYLLFCRRRKLGPLYVGDAMMPSLFIGLALGRIGCLMNGCCWGDRCELPWGIAFPKDSGVTFNAFRDVLPADAGATFLLHPTQIYSSINALILAVVLTAYFHTRPKPGSVIALGWMIYPVTRFILEMLRGDELGQLGTTLTISQWYCLALFVSGLAFAAWLHARGGEQASQSQVVTESAAA